MSPGSWSNSASTAGDPPGKLRGSYAVNRIPGEAGALAFREPEFRFLSCGRGGDPHRTEFDPVQWRSGLFPRFRSPRGGGVRGSTECIGCGSSLRSAWWDTSPGPVRPGSAAPLLARHFCAALPPKPPADSSSLVALGDESSESGQQVRHTDAASLDLAADLGKYRFGFKRSVGDQLSPACSFQRAASASLPSFS